MDAPAFPTLFGKRQTQEVQGGREDGPQTILAYVEDRPHPTNAEIRRGFASPSPFPAPLLPHPQNPRLPPRPTGTTVIHPNRSGYNPTTLYLSTYKKPTNRIFPQRAFFLFHPSPLRVEPQEMDAPAFPTLLGKRRTQEVQGGREDGPQTILAYVEDRPHPTNAEIRRGFASPSPFPAPLLPHPQNPRLPANFPSSSSASSTVSFPGSTGAPSRANRCNR